MSQCDKDQLLRDALCFSCLTPMQLGAIQAQLLCEILNAEGGGPAQNVNIESIGGTLQTGADWTNLLTLLQTLTVSQGTIPWTVDGSVSVSNFPASFGVTQVTSPWVVSVSNAFALETTASSIKTAVEIIDDWDESDRAKVNLIAGQAGITAGAGAVASNTPRVTHASDDPIVTHLDALSKSEDAAHSSGDKGIQILTVRQDTAAALAGANGEYQPPITDSVGRTYGRTVEDRPSQGANRTYKTFNLSNQTADALAYTVTNGKTLYITSLVISCFNTSTVVLGVLELKDGTTAAGTTRVPYLMASAGVAAATAAQGVQAAGVAMLEPLQMTTGVFVDIITGTVTWSIFAIGYEE